MFWPSRLSVILFGLFLRFWGGNGVNNGLQSGKEDIFEGFLLLYHMSRKSRISVSLSDDVMEARGGEVWSSVPLTLRV